MGESINNTIQESDILNEYEIKAALDTKTVGSSVACLKLIDSTNTECKRRAVDGAKDGLIVLAEEQSAGRGRIGKSFDSQRGKGLYYSCLLKPCIKPEASVNITACVAVAVCDAIKKCCGLRPEIKWTNDIILNNKKLCGILTEMDIEAETSMIRYIVIGIGINCNHVKEDFAGELSDIATSIRMESGKMIRRSDLAIAVTKEIDRLYAGFPDNAKEYLKSYRKNCCTIGKHVRLVSPDGSFEEADAIDVDDDFRLVVRMADGSIRTVNAGEVSVRGMCGYV